MTVLRSQRLRGTARLILPPTCALLGFAALLLFSGRDPFWTLFAVIDNGFGSRLGIVESLTKMTPMLLCALAVALPARAGLFNIGGEGQLHVGALGAAMVALFWIWLPNPLVVPVMLVVAVCAGAIWGFIPGFLRGRWKVNEVLVGLMLNYIAILFVEYAVHGPWKDPSALGWPYTASFKTAAVLPTFGATNVHIGLVIACVAAILLYSVSRWTTWGFSMRVMEANPLLARQTRIPVVAYTAVVLAIGGALAAVAGAGEASVIQGRLRSGLSPGFGYSGFLIAWLSANHFLAIIAVSFLVAGLYAGADALQLTAGLPSASADVLMGLVFIGAYLTRKHDA